MQENLILLYLDKAKFHLLDQILVTKTDPSMCLTDVHDGLIEKESEFLVVTRDERIICLIMAKNLDKSTVQ